jgi:hypothetical protein
MIIQSIALNYTGIAVSRQEGESTERSARARVAAGRQSREVVVVALIYGKRKRSGRLQLCSSPILTVHARELDVLRSTPGGEEGTHTRRR